MLIELLQTGFEFKNRQASAIINGIVVAKEYREAVEAVMEGFLDEQNEAEEFKKSIEALKRWRRFLMSLRIRERLGILPEDTEAETKGNEDETKVRGEIISKFDEDEEDTGGGFFAEESENDNGGEGGGFILEGNDSGGGGFLPDERQSEENESDLEILEDPEDEDLGWF